MPDAGLINDANSFTYSCEGLEPLTVYEVHFSALNHVSGKTVKGGKNGYESNENGALSVSFSFDLASGWNWASDAITIDAWVHPLPADVVDPNTGELNPAYDRNFYAVATTSDGTPSKTTLELNAV